jgi:hypothetical protein
MARLASDHRAVVWPEPLEFAGISPELSFAFARISLDLDPDHLAAAAAFAKDQLAINPPRVVDAPLRSRGAVQYWLQLDAERSLDCSVQAFSHASVAVEQMGEDHCGLGSHLPLLLATRGGAEVFSPLSRAAATQWFRSGAELAPAHALLRAGRSMPVRLLLHGLARRPSRFRSRA